MLFVLSFTDPFGLAIFSSDSRVIDGYSGCRFPADSVDKSPGSKKGLIIINCLVWPCAWRRRRSWRQADTDSPAESQSGVRAVTGEETARIPPTQPTRTRHGLHKFFGSLEQQRHPLELSTFVRRN